MAATSEPAPAGERTGRNTAMVAVLALVISVFAMWRMDYLGGPRADYVRMTDSARNAYVAKNVVEGNGYTTNEIPAALVGFYDQRGKLHDEHWANADRFPFTTFAIAALYTVTRTADWWVGITLYNILAFTILMILIYRLSLSIFGSHRSGLFAVTAALLHSGTYYLLYQKDADSVALTVGLLIALIKWVDTPRERRLRLTPLLGTLLAWLFLARPNVAVPVLVYLLFELIRWARDRSESADKLRVMARTYGALAAAFAVWTLPYAIYTWATWGSPFFSANSLYQLPLGTRLSLGGDTWWKYYGPDRVLSFGHLFGEVPTEILWKVVSSWILTFRLCLSSYVVEILAIGIAKLTIWRRGAADRDPPVRASVRTVGRLLFAVVVFNLAILPLFGWAYFPWKQYLVFAMPWVWVFVGHAAHRFVSIACERWSAAAARVQYLAVVFGFAVMIVLLGRSGGSADGTFLSPSLSRWVWTSWIPILVAAGVLLVAWRWRSRALGSTVLAGLVIGLAYQPAVELKSDAVNYFPLSSGVAKTLRQRSGLVSSLALQSEIAWLSGRKQIPVPENVLLLYRYHPDFHVEIEDVYLESAEAMVTPPLGPFTRFMPTLESYARLERYQAPLPGYQIVFHEDGLLGYPKYKVVPRRKASTIYRLSDRNARDAEMKSPDRLALGELSAAVNVSHGFGGYYEIDGRRVVAQTDVTRLRYTGKPPLPYEDGAISFFLTDRLPRQVTVALYVVQPGTLHLYWNLDLDAYDLPSDRDDHELGTVTAEAPGWQTVTLDLPARLVRTGLNKLGVRAGTYMKATSCLAGGEVCAGLARESAVQWSPTAPRYFPAIYAVDVGPFQVSSLWESISFVY